MRYPEYSSVQVVGHSSLAGNMKSLDLEVQQTAQGTLWSCTCEIGEFIMYIHMCIYFTALV